MSRNTAIITENHGAINSEDFWGYAITKAFYKNSNENIGFMLLLVACGDTKAENIEIFNFGTNRSVALEVLEALLQAIDDGDRSWDVLDHVPKDAREMLREYFASKRDV